MSGPIENALPDGKILIIEGEFQLVEPPYQLVYTWRAGEDQTSRVTVGFEPHGEVTEVVVSHEQIPSEGLRRPHEGGWTGCLGGLERYLAHSVRVG